MCADAVESLLYFLRGRQSSPSVSNNVLTTLQGEEEMSDKMKSEESVED